MSRALNVSASQADVKTLAERHDARITSIEPLFPSGTRVVFANGDAAARFARAFKSQILPGPVVRTPLRTRRTS
jgi:hypothetical protein